MSREPLCFIPWDLASYTSLLEKLLLLMEIFYWKWGGR